MMIFAAMSRIKRLLLQVAFSLAYVCVHSIERDQFNWEVQFGQRLA